jgi:hypothetical protein
MFNTKRSMTEIFYVLAFALGILGLVGWCVNIAKIIQTGFVLADWGGLEVARVIGVFLAPLGALLGWF